MPSSEIASTIASPAVPLNVIVDRKVNETETEGVLQATDAPVETSEMASTVALPSVTVVDSRNLIENEDVEEVKVTDVTMSSIFQRGVNTGIIGSS
ncbi:hypothetical protein ACJMK2_026900 [Sinanodonta woodiana]|uniref:Uncharacterized protein n=1 Tax=Sinanodonta woodiana TaxID=1069815 RepID=A0ABD3XL32_SINWO